MIDSIQEQLEPLREAMRAGRPEVKPVVQLTCGVAGGDARSAMVAARHSILNWLREKQRMNGIPDAAWDGEPFEIDVSQDRPVSVEAHDDIWALRFDNPDNEINGRQWRTEAIIGISGGAALLGVRLTVISRVWNLPFFQSIPKVILELAERPGLADYGFPLRASPWEVDSRNDVLRLVELLELPARTRPVFAISVDRSGAPVVDPTHLANRTAGLAHVVYLSPSAAWELSSEVGNRRSVFGASMRTYNPGFSRYVARWDDHPVATREWLDRRFPDRRAFVSLLTNRAIATSVSLPDLEERLPGFTRVRQVLSKRRLDAARVRRAGDKDLLVLYAADNERLREDLQAAEALLEDGTHTQQVLEEERDRVARENFSLRVRIEQLEAWHEQQGEKETVEYPQFYDELDDWVSRYLAGKLTLLPRALRSVKKAEFQDIELLCKSLELLAFEYRDMRRGRMDRVDFDTASAELGVEISPSGDKSRLMQWRSDYEVSWNRERQFLDMHLKKGTAREPRSCLRIYFFWDEDGEQVIVGHLPDHLTTGAT